MKKQKPKKCYWYAQINGRFLFILPDASVLIESSKGLTKMVRENFRNSDYFREPKTSKRIAVSTIKRKAMRCRVLISTILFLISLSCYSQLKKRDIYAASASFTAGMMEGTAETLKWHYNEFESVFPNADEDYWNPEISCKNKYANGTPESGPKYFGSTTFLAWTTDGYHLMRTGRNIMFGATFFLSPKKEFDWRTTLLRIAVYSLSYQAGFHLTYTLVFR